MQIPELANVTVKKPQSSGFDCSAVGLHSSKFTWKWVGGPVKTIILFIGPSMGFYLSLGERRVLGS